MMVDATDGRRRGKREEAERRSWTVSIRFSRDMENERAAEPVSRYEIISARGQGKTNVPCSAYLEQDWQPYLVDPLSV